MSEERVERRRQELDLLKRLVSRPETGRLDSEEPPSPRHPLAETWQSITDAPDIGPSPTLLPRLRHRYEVQLGKPFWQQPIWGARLVRATVAVAGLAAGVFAGFAVGSHGPVREEIWVSGLTLAEIYWENEIDGSDLPMGLEESTPERATEEEP